MLSRQSRINHHSKLIQKSFSRSFYSSHRLNEEKSPNEQLKVQAVDQSSSKASSNRVPVQPAGHQSPRETINKFTPQSRPQTSPVSSPPFVNHQSARGRHPNQHFLVHPRDSKYPLPNHVPPQAYQHQQAPFPRQGAQWQPPRPDQPHPGYNPRFQNFQGPYQPQRIPPNAPQQGNFNQPQNYRSDPNRMYNQSQPQRPPFPGHWRGPPNPHMSSMNPTAFQARSPATDPERGFSESSSNVFAARRKSATGSNQAYSLDLNDVSGLHTLDQFVGKRPDQLTPSSKSPADQNPAPRAPYQNQWNQSQHQQPPHHYFQQPNGPYGTPGLPPQGYRGGQARSAPSTFGQSAPTYRPPMRDGSGWSPNQSMQPRREGMSANRQGGRGGGVGRGRGRGNGQGMSRGRGRGSLFTKIDEPSLPPPPQSVLNAEGKFGEDLNPSGCPYGDVKLSSDRLMIHTSSPKTKKEKEKNMDLAKITNHKTVIQELLKSSTPIQLPGFEKPIQISPLKNDSIQDNYSVESMTTSLNESKKRDEVVGRARKLVSQNLSMGLDQKKQAVGVVDFLLMSSKERMERVV